MSNSLKFKKIVLTSKTKLLNFNLLDPSEKLRYVICFVLFGLVSCDSKQSTDLSLGSKKHYLIDLVTQKIHEHYVSSVDDEVLVEGALNGLLSQLDPYCVYLNQKNYSSLKQSFSGEFNGIGINVVFKKNALKVISPIDGSPAAKGGIKPGDYITHVDGKSLAKFNALDAMQHLQGPLGSNVTLTVRRKNEKNFNTTLRRSFININPVSSREFEQILYIRISTFNEKTEEHFKKIINKLIIKNQIEKSKGVIIDLRNNPGGSLDQAIGICRVLLSKGEIVRIEGRDSSLKEVYKAKEKDYIEGIPIVVLVNEGCASAAEIVAGALQYHKRAILLGTQTFGKGSVQELIQLPGYGAIKLTVAHFFTPAGEPIQDYGITPDIIVTSSKNKSLIFEVSSDKQLKYQTSQDLQLQRALDLLHGMALLNKNIENPV